MPQLTLDQAMALALQHHQAGRLQEAEALYQKILAVAPGNAQAMHLLGVIAGQEGKHEIAIEWIGRAIAADGSIAPYHFNLGVALSGQGQWEQAVEAFRQCLRLDPDHADASNNLGTRLREMGKLDEAIGAYRHAVQLKPTHDFYNNLSMALTEIGQYDEAIAAARQAIDLAPGFADAHWSLALLLLLKGDFDHGWREYEWRWRLKNAASLPYDAQTQWKGSDVNGRTILLYTEQGFGDAIQFIRYAPLIAARGGRVIVQCRRELLRLLETCPGVDQVRVEQTPQAGDVRDFDLHCPLLSLPLAFDTRLETIPAQAKYFDADPVLAEAWKAMLEPWRKRFRVGLAWAGSATRRKDASRSITLNQLAPLAHIPGITFFSLQKGDASRQSAAPPAGMELIDLTAGLDDFADTAALISQLDLVISVDTSVVHLAGALGKPVWALLPFWPDWRWLLDREDSPWYPTARLFRQKSIGDWGEVIARVARELGGVTPRR